MTPIYDAKNHKYYDDKGNIIPSVTQILRAVGISHPYKQAYGEKGTAVHEAILNYDEYGVWPQDAEIASYLEGYKLFRKEQNDLFIGRRKDDINEVPLACDTIWVRGNTAPFAGTADKVCVLYDTPVEGSKCLYAHIFDFKTGNPDNSHLYQLLGYKLLIEANFPDYSSFSRGFAVYLRPAAYEYVEVDYKKLAGNLFAHYIEIMDLKKRPMNELIISKGDNNAKMG
jgi:hypothetical protein